MPRPKWFSSFFCLNFAQFLAAFNDNLYKLLLIFFVISIKGEEHSNTILSLAGIVFVIPFLLFASLAGLLADKYSKRKIILITRFIEIFSTAVGVIAFITHSVVLAYVVLFFMATHSAIFSPSKYGVIPELVGRDRISHCNGVITASTYLAIILGTFFASFLADVTDKNFSIAIFFPFLVSIFGTLFSLGIEKTKPQSQKKVSIERMFTANFRALSRTRLYRYLYPVIVFGAYFLFMGSYVQLNMIPFSIESLKLSDVQGGYLFLMTALGIGVGSFAAGKMMGKEVEIGFVPFAGILAAICFISLFTFQWHFFAVVPLLFFLGLFGGFFVVPMDVFIQVASPDKDRGQNVATSSMLGFVGAILASLLLAFLGNGLGLSAAEGFLVVGFITLLVSIVLLFLFADQVARLLISTMAKLFWDLKVVGKKRLEFTPPVLLIGERTSWIDTMIVMATLPRLIRYIVPADTSSKRRSFLYKLLCVIPVEKELFQPIGKDAFFAMKRELRAGHSVCLMHPVSLPSKTLKDWKSTIEAMLEDVNVPVAPIHIIRKKGEQKASFIKQIIALFKMPIRVAYGRRLEELNK